MALPTWQKSHRYLRMEARVASNRLDSEAWMVMLSEAQLQLPADYRPVFEACVTAFPDAGCCWKQWVELELRARDLEQVELLFTRCLIRCPHLGLWRLYLLYLKELGKPPDELTQAYEVGSKADAPLLRSSCPCPHLHSLHRAGAARDGGRGRGRWTAVAGLREALL
jgi:hypothetical protein